jgi:bifunctional non-homologous end joining protein LigD
MLPAILSPQLCTLTSDIMTSDEWLHEIKYDGWRLLARKDAKSVRLYTRGGVEWSARLPKLAAAIQSLGAKSAWLDGELVYLDANGFPRFELLHRAIRSSDEASLYFQVWDLPWLNGRNLCDRPLLERKRALFEVLDGAPPRIRMTSHVEGNGAAFFRAADEHNLEGIVSKRIVSRYHAGKRTRDWLKVKCWRTHRFFVGGIERDEDGRLVALLVGSPAGGQLQYKGRVEFGLHRVTAVWKDQPNTARCPFSDPISNRTRTWLHGRSLIEIRALPCRDGGALRHATAIAVVAR